MHVLPNTLRLETAYVALPRIGVFARLPKVALVLEGLRPFHVVV